MSKLLTGTVGYIQWKTSQCWEETGVSLPTQRHTRDQKLERFLCCYDFISSAQHLFQCSCWAVDFKYATIWFYTSGENNYTLLFIYLLCIWGGRHLTYKAGWGKWALWPLRRTFPGMPFTLTHRRIQKTTYNSMGPQEGKSYVAITLTIER